VIEQRVERIEARFAEDGDGGKPGELAAARGAATAPAHATVRDARRAAAARLAAAGCESSRLDAELLLAHALGADRATLARAPERALDAREAEGFEALVARRAARAPVAYLTGRRAFRRLELAVDERVLVPRPETELLVEVALELPQGARVLDVGTGSGAVALAVKDERPDLDVRGVDASPAALEVARANAVRLGLDVAFARADLLEGVFEGARRDGASGGGMSGEGTRGEGVRGEGVGEPLDAVLANLPYVDPGDWDALPPEVRHEPRDALVAPRDGLALIRRLVAQAASGGLLAQATGGSPAQAAAAGLFALEVGAGQAPAVRKLLADAGFAAVETRRDLAGIERVVVGRRGASANHGAHANCYAVAVMAGEIPQRELRNDVSSVLRRVEAGETLRVTVRGRPVAQIGPLTERGRFVTRERLVAALAGTLAPGDAAALRTDLVDALSETIDDL
jgi:release factor glutamine methyltransferase